MAFVSLFAVGFTPETRHPDHIAVYKRAYYIIFVSLPALFKSFHYSGERRVFFG